MKLYIKQKVFSFADRFSIFDAQGNPKYWAEGELFSWTKKLHVKDESGEEVITIQQDFWNWLPTFSVFYRGKQFAVIKGKFSIRPRYDIQGPGWSVEGNLLGLDYAVSSPEGEIASIHRAWMSWGDSYEVHIYSDINELPVLAVVLGIDAAIAISNN